MIRTSAPWRWAFDVFLALVLGVFGQVQLVVPNDDGYFEGPHTLSVVLMALTALPLMLRRVFPVQVALVVFGVHIVPSLVIAHSVTFWGTILPMAVALYSAARWGTGRFTPALLVLPFAFIFTYGIHVEQFNTWDEFVFTALLMGSAWAAGHVIRRLTWQRRALDEALQQLEAREHERRQQVLLEERTRIAREMHDVVAHGVSVMVVQAGAARLELAESDTAARESLLAVEQTGRQVLDELRRTVSLLRTPDDASASARPSPGLADVPDLIAAMRTAGLDVDATLDPGLESDPGRELAAFRVIQEALTNVLRHAGPTRVKVRVSADPHLRVEVTDAGARRESGGLQLGRGGHGLVGMRERVAVYGGSLDAGPAGRGFTVSAEFPMDPTR
ncbi:MAG TPA: sensor histidine kinase [Actinomycetales bacterium]|nr:sensor histidine kinase [Actinomycetales bacterium]